MWHWPRWALILRYSGFCWVRLSGCVTRVRWPNLAATHGGAGTAKGDMHRWQEAGWPTGPHHRRPWQRTPRAIDLARGWLFILWRVLLDPCGRGSLLRPWGC